MLHKQQLLSQSEFDQRSAQTEAAERQFDMARNTAAQQYQSLLAARARVTLAQKALADTTVRAPFAGVVGERFVSVGDYVTRGTKVATVMRVDPLRVELTVPEQFVSVVASGRDGDVRSGCLSGRDLRSDRFATSRRRWPPRPARSRSKPSCPNSANRLKPGFFATAQIEQANMLPGLLVPATAVRTISGTARVFVINGDRVEERVVMVGQAVGDRVEVTSGIKAGERVVADGMSTASLTAFASW